MAMHKLIPPPHPGEAIAEDILAPLKMSVNQLAKHLGVMATRLNDIVRGRRAVTADTALRPALPGNFGRILDGPAIGVRSPPDSTEGRAADRKAGQGTKRGGLGLRRRSPDPVILALPVTPGSSPRLNTAQPSPIACRPWDQTAANAVPKTPWNAASFGLATGRRIP